MMHDDFIRDEMDQQLKAFAEGQPTQNLTILYNDMHGLWGGVTVTLSTNGAYERLERAQGAIVPELVRRTVTIGQVQEVIGLLLDTRAWEQQSLQRTPIPDEVTLCPMCVARKIPSSTGDSPLLRRKRCIVPSPLRICRRLKKDAKPVRVLPLYYLRLFSLVVSAPPQD
jgi:hypothetical protein